MRFYSLAATAIVAFCVSTSQAANIDDLGTWTLAEDPPHPNLSATLDSSTQATLSANGAVPATVDIGYQSVDGADVANSTAGHYFSAGESFSVAIDFEVSANASMGLAGIGFGIGEDAAGNNSAGVGLAILNGTPTTFSGASRINNVTQPIAPLPLAATSSGRFFVAYDEPSGDITYGVNPIPGSLTPSSGAVFSGLQNNWPGEDLLVSFFLRSDTFLIAGPLSSGSVDAVFSNFTVLSGTAVAAVPEPGTIFLVLTGMGALLIRRRR